jgi:hypothetical protein
MVREQKRKAMDNCREGKGGPTGLPVPESKSNQVESHSNSLPATSVPFAGHPRPGQQGPRLGVGTRSDVTNSRIFFYDCERPPTVFSVPSSAEGTQGTGELENIGEDNGGRERRHTCA